MRVTGGDVRAPVWACLAINKLGVPFRRQYVIGELIADFAAPSIRLVVEVDWLCS